MVFLPRRAGEALLHLTAAHAQLAAIRSMHGHIPSGSVSPAVDSMSVDSVRPHDDTGPSCNSKEELCIMYFAGDLCAAFCPPLGMGCQTSGYSPAAGGHCDRSYLSDITYAVQLPYPSYPAIAIWAYFFPVNGALAEIGRAQKQLFSHCHPGLHCRFVCATFCYETCMPQEVCAAMRQLTGSDLNFDTCRTEFSFVATDFISSKGNNTHVDIYNKI